MEELQEHIEQEVNIEQLKDEFQQFAQHHIPQPENKTDIDELNRILGSRKLRKKFGIKLTPYKREYEKIGRNKPCPCGSGLKNKKCCEY